MILLIAVIVYQLSTLRQIEERYEEPATFGRCDCTSYSYLALSVVLFTIGTAVTILSLGDAVDGQIFSNLGHMWLVGPIFICSGLMVAVKCILYLRRKSVIQMIIHQRQLFRELASAQGVGGSGAGTPGPPPYDSIAQGQGPSELPPPTYAEAVALLHQSEIHGAKFSSDTQADSGLLSVGTTRAKP
ncbi:GSCOCG00002719001-RA-CDS [Cotesia congregata]|nr:GSCOCG00002719001-RA-CDS [Cotesia congregata]